VLAARSNAFLRVDGALELRKVGVGVCGAEEDGLVLVHAGLSPALKLDRIQSSLTHIGKEQCRVLIGNGGGGGHEGVVVLLLEKVDECGPDLVGRPVALSKEALQSVAVASEASTNWLAVEDILTRRAGKPRADSVRSRGDRSRMLASSSQVCKLSKLLSRNNLRKTDSCTRTKRCRDRPSPALWPCSACASGVPASSRCSTGQTPAWRRWNRPKSRFPLPTTRAGRG
jgi:hypothetical protein